MIDRYLVRYFLAVVDYGNFSRAAARCSVSQPTLSVGIAKLERALDRRLFTRTNQRVELTDAGTRFLAHARRIEREFNAALGAMAETGQQQTLRLGVLHSVPGAIVAEASRAARPDLPGPIEILFGSERELAGLLERGRIDAALAILRPGSGELIEHRVIDEGYAVAMAADHPLADRTEVAAEELRGETMIVRRHCEILPQTSRHFVERGVRPHFSLRTTNDERALALVGAGMGITVMPDCYRDPAVRHVRLQGFELRRTLGFRFAEEAVARHPLLEAVARVLRASA